MVPEVLGASDPGGPQWDPLRYVPCCGSHPVLLVFLGSPPGKATALEPSSGDLLREDPSLSVPGSVPEGEERGPVAGISCSSLCEHVSGDELGSQCRGTPERQGSLCREMLPLSPVLRRPSHPDRVPRLSRRPPSVGARGKATCRAHSCPV